MRKFLSTFVLLMMASFASAQDKTLRINIAVEPESMDPVLNESLAGSRVMKGLNEGLILLDDKAHAVPGISDKWNTTPTSPCGPFTSAKTRSGRTAIR